MRPTGNEFHRHLRGFAIHQGGVFKLHRAAFQVETVGREKIDGRDIVVLDYRQTAPVAGFVLPVPKELGNPPRLHRGRLWLDAETGQLWRDIWELVVPHPAPAEPLVMLRQERTYGPSRFGIPVPQRIVFEWFMRFSHPKNGRPSFLLSERTTFTYDAFNRFDVTTDETYRGSAGPRRAVVEGGTGSENGAYVAASAMRSVRPIAAANVGRR